jgi:hypothetical protein
MQRWRAAFFLLAVATASPTATATALRVEGEPTSVGGCNLVRGDVVRWNRGGGPPAAFIAERFVAGSGNELIALGADAAGFWTAETAVPSDGCDDCRVLKLVHTTFAGKRKSYVVADAATLGELEANERRARVKGSLFKLAAGPWNVRELSQRYRLRLVKHDGEGRIHRYTGWFADVRVPGQPGLRYGIRSESFMCWCSDAWLAYPLRA